MYHIPGVLSPQDVARFREQLEQAEWVDGRVTTGAQGAQVKNNQQVDTRSTLYAALQNEVLNAVNQHALFFAAALPRTLSTPLFNRYQNNETYGFHVDGAVRSHPQNGWMRTDLSATLFLSDPQSYDGGVRVASFMWIQSMIRDDKKRAMLFELDNNIQSLKSRYGESEEILSLLNLYHNLLREWSEI